MKRKLKLTLEYDGARYCGWQSQPNGTAIQDILQQTLERITKQKTTVIGSGRTDAGVHAEAQVAHFITESGMKPLEFLKALNSLLPNDIVIKEVKEVPLEFHAQMSAVGKIYRYTVLTRDHPSALSYGRCLYTPYPLDLAAMRRGCRYLVGEHDFTSFRGPNCKAMSPVRTIKKITVWKDGAFIHFQFEGTGFLKYMIRIIMGTLLEVGHGRIPARRVREILEARDRQQAGPTAQPQGLFLVQVFYGKDNNGKKKVAEMRKK